MAATGLLRWQKSTETSESGAGKMSAFALYSEVHSRTGKHVIAHADYPDDVMNGKRTLICIRSCGAARD